MTTLDTLIEPHAERVERDMDRWTVEPGTPDTLAEAMRYCALGGGKRLRPALVCLAAAALGANAEQDIVRRAAVAVELVHTYSLVHDDLPAMDDDTLRRGRPTAHVKFGETLAILAGDALLTRAFGVLGESRHPVSGALVGELAAAAGPAGMVAGQVADMNLCSLPDGPEGLTFTHERKTAALLRGACRMGAIAGGGEPHGLTAVSTYGYHLGLAFQLVDDLLDVTGSAEELGKTPGKDRAAGKRTHADQFGADRAGDMVTGHTRQAAAALQPLSSGGDGLVRLADLLAERTR